MHGSRRLKQERDFKHWHWLGSNIDGRGGLRVWTDIENGCEKTEIGQ